MEFNAIVFCGKGHKLDPLTTDNEFSSTKALLPIANRPMVEYVLGWCDEAPFKSINVVCDVKSERSIAEAIRDYESRRDVDLKASSPIKLIPFDTASTGAAIAHHFPTEEHTNENYVVLPCDFITDVPPQVLIETYRQYSDQNIGMSVFYNNIFENIDKKQLKTNYTLYANQDDDNNVLLDMYSKDFVTFDKFLKIRTQLLWRYPSTNVSTKLLDSFIFFVSSDLRQVSNDVQMNRSVTKIKRDLARRSWKHSKPNSTIGMFALPDKALFIRCNNLATYMEANRHLLQTRARTQAKPVGSKDKNAATVGNDSLLGDSVTLGERTSVKKSVIGSNCVIGKKCRISNCVLLDDVVIGDDVQLENCIIGRRVKMESKCKLVNCNLEGSYVVGTNVDIKGETLKNIHLNYEDDGMQDLYNNTSDEDSEGDKDQNDSELDDDEDDEEYAEYNDYEDYGEDIFAR